MGYALRKEISGSQLIDCESNVVVGDYVYMKSNSKLAKAKADSRNTMPAVGIVKQLAPNNKCVIVQTSLEAGHSGLTTRQRVFISPNEAGKITTTPPNSPSYILQCVGEAKSETEILVSIDPTNYIIRQ
jgi:hypothetical protein